MALRLVFMGTPDFAVPTLLGIVGAGHEIVAVYTRAPQPAGRGMELGRGRSGAKRSGFGLPVLTPKTLKGTDAAATMRAHGTDAAVVVAYGLILPKPILDAFRLGCFNLHASLLPRWRGAAPIQRAIIAGDRETGVMVMKMEEDLDTGPVAMAERVPIGPDVTAGDMHDTLTRLGADLMLRALGALEKGALQLTPQSAGGVTYASKIDKNETRIDWTKSWQQVHDHCRGLSPFPGAWFEFLGNGGAGRVKVLRTTRTGGHGKPGHVLDERSDYCLRRRRGPADRTPAGGRQPMLAADFLRGMPIGRECVLV